MGDVLAFWIAALAIGAVGFPIGSAGVGGLAGGGCGRRVPGGWVLLGLV